MRTHGWADAHGRAAHVLRMCKQTREMRMREIQLGGHRPMARWGHPAWNKAAAG